MTEQHSERGPSSADRFLDSLLDALLERQRQRREASKDALPGGVTKVVTAPSASAQPNRPAGQAAAVTKAPVVAPAAEPSTAPESIPTARPEPREPLPSIGMDRLIRRMLIGLVLAVVLINIPVAAHGLSLARLLPDSASLVIRDGLVLKGSGDRIYMLQDEQLRWISSMDAFEHLGLSWDDVHRVDDAFLERFAMGRPLDILAKCDGSPHIYVLRDGEKHWIRDIEVFVAEGYVWDDVTFVSCPYLRALPDGETIPPDAGTPPRP